MCGEEQVAIDAAAVLLEHGLVVPAIRPPTVAPGTSRLRVAMSAAHTDAHIDRLLAALGEVFGDVPSSRSVPYDDRGRRRDRHRNRQDVGHRRVRNRAAASAASRSWPASRCSRSRPSTTLPTDAEILGEATVEDPHVVCPPHRWLPRAMAPPMAADGARRRPFTVAELAAEVTSNLPRGAIVLVESVGGVRSPLAVDGDTVTLVDRAPPALVVLVADAELGTINVVRLSVDVLISHRVVVYLNRYDTDNEMHVRNHDWLASRMGLDVVADPEALEEIVATLR